MTSPSDDDTQALPTAPPPAAASSAPDSASGGPAAATHNSAPAAPSQPGIPSYGYFPPIVRTPWVNPAKRGAVAAVAVAAALVIGGGGLVTGFAIGAHHARQVDNVRIQQGPFGPGFAPGRNGAFPQHRGRYFPRPSTTTPTPQPTSTPTPTATKTG